MTMVSDATHVYCPNCRDIHPAIFDALEGRDVTAQFEAPMDVVCDHCKFIVATFYRELASVARPA
jgi:hypothetical protein